MKTCYRNPLTVVDPRLRNYKIAGLRVVDKSIIPNVVTGNTNAPSIMVPKMVLDMIKEDWDKKM